MDTGRSTILMVMGRGTGQTWKEKMAADTAYVSQFPQSRGLFDNLDKCEHKTVIRRYEILGDDFADETMCNDCGLSNPPSFKGQKILWKCDCDFENANSRSDCKRCGTKRGQRIPEIYSDGTRREDWIEPFLNNLSETTRSQ